ncbi:protein daughter of sevenless [Trichonephila inaurata madagascariensis]|uniref:Protein daughter of sevenless n=1 Tax=Trichonephila inaurata madagascariensis TaxID=2747483 RepID=A0A8X6XGD5_9ARAC|nr:protein daughter of sevenless [Trichonephila inaurata madagascariensis]
MEGVVHDGWLVKSPPEKRIVKPKWRQRWFVLRHSGLLPGQFILEYFTDSSCKKLKGKIDLDQCEQIDAGLPVDSKVAGYQYMFDIRTPKRTYYLIAETEADMNKWVECICSVCGLKIHTEEDFLMPQDPSNNPNSVITSSNLTAVRSSSNPYIPISECYTGKPVLNGNFSSLDGLVQLNTSQSTNSSGDNFADVPKEPPPPPPKTDWTPVPNPISDEFYDHPKPINLNNVDSNHAPEEMDNDETYKIPMSIKSNCQVSPNFDVFSTLPPKVNWKTYPDDAFLPSSSTVPRRKSSASSEVNVYDVVPSFHGSIKEIKPQQKKVQSLASHFENMALKTSPDTQNRFQESTAEYINQTSIVPPRPPKPSKMRERHRYENFELPHQKQKEDPNYDIPPPTKGLVLTKQQALKSEESEDNTLSENSSVKETTMDDMYDFPQPQHVAKFRGEDNINAAVPAPQNTGTSQRSRRHAYTNAPPGLFNSKDLIFNYEYRPSLVSDDYFAADGCRSLQCSSDAATPPSPSAIGAYANVPTSPTLISSIKNEIPPAVNRELKPKRVMSNEDQGSFSFLTLQPPPVCRSRTKADKRSFRKPRAAPSPTPISSVNGMPPVPNRFRHHPEMSATSDDEGLNSSGSRRNSSTDEQARHFFAAPAKRDEIQYLDLDLDSEPSPSPKTPDRLSASTVYKKVDFVKTKAFNEMRQNVEESYRKSQ